MPFQDLLSEIGLAAFVFAFGAMFLAGFAKGVVGFALPMIAISLIGSILPATLAVAALIAPTVVSNVWQTFRQGTGAAFVSLRRFWLLNLVLFAMIALCSQLILALPEAALFAILGVGVTGFGSIMLLGWRPPHPPARLQKAVEAGVAAVAGFFGGLSGVWGPPLVMYFTALELPKTEMVRAQGVSFLLGSVILVAAHLRSGLLLGQGGALSLAMIVPALLGMSLGVAVHDRLDQGVFRKATLAVLILAGLNLLRRALAG
ncbi:MAG: sulfite exporter TauE/SafE family protein [Pseudomonadota bacterium]